MYRRALMPQPMQQRLPKYRRTDASRQAVAHRRITERDLVIIETIARFRLVPSSLLVRLIPGDRTATYEHLQTLYHRELINRFHLPRTGPANEFIYYLDNLRAAALLADFERDTTELDLSEIKRNRANAYHRVNAPDVAEEQKPSLLFVRHELMITRFQACLELACAASNGAVQLVTFCRSRNSLKHPVVAPKLECVTDERGREVWRETKEWEWLPHAPDAFFSLRFLQQPEDSQERHFFYEADRATESVPRFARKLRGHHQFILRQKHKQHLARHYGVQRIRAVLTETISDEWATTLRLSAASHPMIAPKPSGLFWFTTSRLLTHGPQSASASDEPRQLPYYLTNPQIILNSIWATPADETLYSLQD